MPTSGALTVQHNLEATIAQIQASAEIAVAEVMTALEGWVKSEHTYTDRTANTTNSIQGQVAEVSAELVRGVLSAGTPQSVFLELCRDGKWAFLWPTIERHKDDILTIIKARMEL